MSFLKKPLIALAALSGVMAISAGLPPSPVSIHPVPVEADINRQRKRQLRKQAIYGGRLTGRIGGNQRQLRKDRRRFHAAGIKSAFR